MASASKDRSVRIWVPKVKGHSLDFKPHSSAVTSVQFSPNGKKVILSRLINCSKFIYHRSYIFSWLPHRMTKL